jgi:hypothetical protein
VFSCFRVFVFIELIVYSCLVCPQAEQVSRKRSETGSEVFSLLVVSSSSSTTLLLLLRFPVLLLLLLRMFYIRLIVKFPFPVHPEVTPESSQVPEIVLFFTIPCSASVLPLGVSD